MQFELTPALALAFFAVYVFLIAMVRHWFDKATMYHAVARDLQNEIEQAQIASAHMATPEYLNRLAYRAR